MRQSTESTMSSNSDGEEPMADAGVAVTGWICQNFPAHPNEEIEMVSAGPGEGGVICPECGRMANHPDHEIPYGDPPYTFDDEGGGWQ